MFVANITTAITKASEEMFDIRDKDGTLRGGSLKPNQENESPNKREEFLEHWFVRELTQEKIFVAIRTWDKSLHKRRSLLKDK